MGCIGVRLDGCVNLRTEHLGLRFQIRKRRELAGQVESITDGASPGAVGGNLLTGGNGLIAFAVEQLAAAAEVALDIWDQDDWIIFEDEALQGARARSMLPPAGSPLWAAEPPFSCVL